jgi:hypothetical protein
MIESISYFVMEAIWSFGILPLSGAIGLGPVLLFKNSLRFPVLASPLAGLLLVNVTTLIIYDVVRVGYDAAALCAAGLCIITSMVLCAAYCHNLQAKDVAISVLLLGVTTVCFAWLSNAAAIKNGAPSIMYFDGTDHLGYANVADWMRDHMAWPGGISGIDGPRADPAHPYESLPNLLLVIDPRSGAFGFLALIGLIRQLPSTFAYDPASGVLLSAAVLGVAAVFARSWIGLAVLALGLSFSSWYELSHSGFLGKVTAYPANLFCLGLFFHSRRTKDLRIILIVLILCAASALFLSGFLTAAVFVTLGGSAVLIAWSFEKSLDWDQVSRLAMCVFVSVLAVGFFAHPSWGIAFGFGGVAHPATFVAARSLDLEGWTTATGFGDTTLFVMIAITMLAGFCAAWIALMRRSSNALALLITPAAIYAVLLLFTSRAELIQTTGLLYPAMLCGLGLLLSELQNIPRRGLALATIGCLVITAALRAPHAIAAVHRYTSPEAIIRAYSKDEIDLIANAIGQGSALVDFGKSPHQSILMLVELGRRGLALQWTPDTWGSAVAGWRGWPLPKYETPADLRIVTADRKDMGTPIYSGPHFAVLRNQD